MYKLRILAVDDEQGMRSGIQRALGNYKMRLPDIDDDISFEMELAETGAEAIEKYNSFKPDIILLDYKLPDLTGLEVLEQISTNEAETLTIMITAYASLDTAVSAIKSGAFDFLAKPFTPKELRNTISKAAQSLMLARQVKKLNEERKQVRFQFISVLGHELKAPLSAIEGYLNMVVDRVVGDELVSYDDMIKRCLVRTEQMRKLIIDLLEMTKIESGQNTREIKETDLSEIVKMSIETMLPDAEKRGISINLDCPAPLMIKADKVEMDIIFNNLVSNAVKYNRDNGKVDISISEDDGKFTIRVKDTGIGLSKEEAAKLFNEFVRIKNKNTKNILGSGLGLSTVKKIAIIYGGDATVDSVPEQGSTFTVTLMNKAENA